MATISRARIAFAIATLSVVILAVWRRHENHATQDAKDVAAQHRVVRRTSDLRHLASIAGTIRDDNGVPVANARVCAISSTDPQCVASDRHGQYAIDDLAAGRLQVSAMAPQLALELYMPNGPAQPAWFSLFATERRRGVDIVLHRGGALVTGTVSDIAGGVIPHAHVRVTTSWQRLGSAGIEVETDEHGHYEAWTHPAGVTATVDAEGYATGSRDGVAPAQIDVAMTVESTLGGTVIDAASEKPLADVTVAASSDTGMTESVTTDEHGKFFIARLHAGRYTAYAHTSHGTGQADGSTELALGGHADVVVRLYPAQQVVAHVIADGKPCAVPSALLIEEHHNLQFDLELDSDGTLHADGVLPGTYVVIPGCEGFVRDDRYEPVVVAARDVEASWAVHAGVTVTGRVRTESGASVAFVDVSVQSADTAAREPTIYVGDRTTADGSFTLRGLRPGKYQLTVDRPLPPGVWGANGSTHIDIDAIGDITKDVVIPDLGGTITGTVKTGSPGHLQIQARSTGDVYQTIATTDDAGHFEIPDLVAATYTLYVLGGSDHGLVENYTPEGATKVDVTAGHTVTANLVVDLPNGEIRGRVVDPQGMAVSDAYVGFARESDDAPAIRGARNDNDELLVTAEGRFVADHLSKGPYTVRVSRKGSGETILAHVPIGSDITLTLKPTAEITGVAHRGTPIDDLHVSLIDRDTEDRVRDESFFRTEGRFAIHDVPAGHYRVVFSTGGSVHTLSLDLAEGEQSKLDVPLEGTVTLVGHAVDARDRHPVAGISMAASISNVSLPYLVPADMRNRSGDDGRFEIPNVPRGDLEISGSSLDLDGRVSDPISLRRTIGADEPDVIDIGNVAIVTMTRGNIGDYGLMLDGAKVTQVEPNGAAAEAGIFVGDVITAIDGFATDQPREMLIGDAGIAIQVTLERGDTVTLVLGPSSITP